MTDTNSLRDIKPPLEIPNAWLWVLWGLAALTLAALLYLAWRRWQKHRAQAAAIPAIPPHIRAKQKLQEALSLLGQPREPELRDLHDAALRLVEETEPPAESPDAKTAVEPATSVVSAK